MVTHKNVIAEAAGVLQTLPKGFELTENEIHLSFLPLAHIFEQLVMAALLGLGAQVGFYRGDVLKLVSLSMIRKKEFTTHPAPIPQLDDVALLQPTIFPAVPRLLNRIYDKIMATVGDAPVHRRFLFNKALQYKKSLLRRGYIRNDTFWDKLVFGKIRARLGGR